MRRETLLVILCFSAVNIMAQWKPAGDKIQTEWVDKVDPDNVLSEYPRPIMERSEWQNLNGLWEYTITPVGSCEPAKYDGRILVPYAIESSLSGVQKEVGEYNELWYRRTFHIPLGWKHKSVLLHFGAVDWKAEIFLNSVKLGTHAGGYTPFSFDISPYLVPGDQELVVKVWDGTDKSYQPRGKQVSNPRGIWYSSVTGIWQTVWLEPVSSKYITRVKCIPDVDSKRFSVNVFVPNAGKEDIVEIKLFDENVLVSSAKSVATERSDLYVSEPKLWSPDSPFLYDVEISLYHCGKKTDEIRSYCAMRKVSMKKDASGIKRIQLNNEDYIHLGVLDQGWWPDGLYTAPTDEALIYDIQKAKDLGFNMIRKHVKVEPARWYTHCDRLGLLVWQDMPNGDSSPEWQNRNYFNGLELERSFKSETNYRKEWKEIIDYLFSYPSIVAWVPFNEAWGQFKTDAIADWTKQYDPSRLVNAASGGNHYPVGDMLDLHNYPEPEMYIYDPERVNVLGEYGGIGLPLKGHLWQEDKSWGYIQFKNRKEVTDEYLKYAEMLRELIKKGFSASVYTQITDVEGEVNGLLTYDRKILKVDEHRIREVNKNICNILIIK